jgi:hypothetical protein
MPLASKYTQWHWAFENFGARHGVFGYANLPAIRPWLLEDDMGGRAAACRAAGAMRGVLPSARISNLEGVASPRKRGGITQNDIRFLKISKIAVAGLSVSIRRIDLTPIRRIGIGLKVDHLCNFLNFVTIQYILAQKA